jgi:hypothetical protein
MRLLPAFILFFVFFTGIASADTITLSPCDQNGINQALSTVYQSGGGEVYLNPGVYEITGPINIGSNTLLTGDPNAIIRVSASSSHWFTNSVGIINAIGILNNVEICGFQIDGNCENLPVDYSHTSTATAHDCEALIHLCGDTGNFMNNIKIYNMTLFDSFSDGICLRFVNNADCYNNLISNCEHEGTFYVCAIDSLIYSNKIAGITSDCLRLDNSISCKVYDNILFSYSGSHAVTYMHGENGIQIGDAGASHGYDASNKPTSTENIEVFNNTFANNGLQAILLDAVALAASTNVFIHDNHFIGQDDLETMGIPVELGGGMPSLQQSKQVFSSIFDILNRKFADTGRTEQTADDIPLRVTSEESGIIAGGVKIVGVRDKIKLDNTYYIPDESAVLVQTKVIQNPNFEQWAGIIKQMDKNVSIKIENGTATALLTVKASWYTTSKNSITGTITKSSLKTSSSTFIDSYSPVPEILQRNNTEKVTVNVFEDTKNPFSRVKIEHFNATQRIEFTYGENTSIHKFMIGERLTDENGLKYTSYSRCDMWNGSIPHMGDEFIIYGKFDPVKLHINYFTPYESTGLKDFEIIYHKNEGENPIITTLKFILYMLLAMYAGYKIMKIII